MGLHFWPSSSLIYGVRVDYLSPTLYFLDLLIISYLSLNRFTGLPAQAGLRIYGAPYFIILLLSNLIFSINPLSTLSWSLHLLLYISFFSSFSLIINQKLLTTSLFLASLFQLSLSVTQVWLGRSIQGPLYYLGERMVSVGQPGVALAMFMDQVVLRAYGTFGHPNVLAGWLVITFLIILRFSKNIVINYSYFLITILGALLTQSRSALLSLFGIIIPVYMLKSLRVRALYFAILFSLAIGYWSLVVPERADLSLSERLSLQSVSLKAIANYPIFGTGAQASIASYPQLNTTFRLLQPDHNSFTLFVSWFGLAGILSIIYLIRLYGYTAIRLYDYLPLFPLLLLDHYLLTSPQGLLILLLYLKVVNYSHVQKHRE